MGKRVHDARLIDVMLTHEITHLLTFNTEQTILPAQQVLSLCIQRHFLLELKQLEKSAEVLLQHFRQL